MGSIGTCLIVVVPVQRMHTIHASRSGSPSSLGRAVICGEPSFFFFFFALAHLPEHRRQVFQLTLAPTSALQRCWLARSLSGRLPTLRFEPDSREGSPSGILLARPHFSSNHEIHTPPRCPANARSLRIECDRQRILAGCYLPSRYSSRGCWARSPTPTPRVSIRCAGWCGDLGLRTLSFPSNPQAAQIRIRRGRLEG